MEIKPLSPYQYKLRGEEGSNVRNYSILFKYYFIDGFEANNRKKIRQVEKFALEHRDKGYEKYHQYEIIFYRKTASLNEKYRESPSNPIAEHDNDLVMHFLWRDGSYSSYMLLENGNCLNCKGELEEVK